MVGKRGGCVGKGGRTKEQYNKTKQNKKKSLLEQ